MLLTPRAGPTKAEIVSAVIEVMSAREIEPMPVAGPITLRPSAVRYDGLSVNPMWTLPPIVMRAPPSRRRFRSRSRPCVYSAVWGPSDWIQSSGRLRWAALCAPKSLPSRLTAALNRGSAAMTCTAVAPPIEWPMIPTRCRSRWPASGERGSSRATRLSWSRAKLASAARMLISRSIAGCGGGPITSGWVVCPTTCPPASTVTADS
jgi:hypothetical protein